MRRIRREELDERARSAGFSVGEAELEEYHVLTEAIFGVLEALEAQPSAPVQRLAATRDLGRPASRVEDPLNAVVRWCDVHADVVGPLSGKRVAVKDNIAVAGIPTSFGSRVMDGYLPERDAVVTERLLRAGARIVGKLNMDSFAWSGGGETSAFGPILNPFDHGRTAAGSSGGSAAALYYHDDVDVTFGTDQGGSIRLPAAWCGVLGLKPTFGLVPYTGIGSMDGCYDHVGPMARTVEDLALALAAVAGADPSDFRQDGAPVEDYVGAVRSASDNLRGLRVGVLREGSQWADAPDAPEGTEQTEWAFREVMTKFAEAGAEVREVSVPQHLTASPMMFASLIEGQTALLRGCGNVYGSRGRASEDLTVALGKGIRAYGDDLPPTVKMVLLIGTHLNERYFSSLYAKAQNLVPELRSAYDAALRDVDILAMPTATHYAHRYDPDASISQRVLRGWTMLGNTGAFNATGHPALSIPAAEADGLPVGVMLVGQHFADANLLRVARTYERIHGWLPHRPGSVAD